MSTGDALELFWDHILSRQPGLIRTAFASLDKPSQNEVLAHLQRMASEEGWHPEQVNSAQAALAALNVISPGQ